MNYLRATIQAGNFEDPAPRGCPVEEGPELCVQVGSPARTALSGYIVNFDPAQKFISSTIQHLKSDYMNSIAGILCFI